jgi:diacylglycerol kinase family enzyme
MMMLIVANARIFGGGFKIAPQADPADGKLDAVAFENMGLGGRVEAMVRLLIGTTRLTRRSRPSRPRGSRAASTSRRPTRPTASGTAPAPRSS